MDTTVVDTEATTKETGEKSPETDKFVSSYVTDNATGKIYRTLSLPDNVIANLLDFNTNNYSNNAQLNTQVQTGGVANSQTGGELSSPRSGYVTTPPNTMVGTIVNMNAITLKNTGTVRKNTDPRTRTERRRDVPNSVDNNILGYTSSLTSDDEHNKPKDPYANLPHSPNSRFEFLNPKERALYEQELRDIETAKKASNEPPFVTPRRFSSNFEKLIREKSKKTISTTSNKFTPLTDESEADCEDDEIGKIVKNPRRVTNFDLWT